MNSKQIDRPSLSRLREVLGYDPDTGKLVWKQTLSNRAPIGTVVTGAYRGGRLRVRVDGWPGLAHTVIWCMTHGAWPTHQIDHINGDPSDNRLANLRDVPQSLNMQNLRKARADNSHGFLGVVRRGIKWRARLLVDGKQVYCGTYGTGEEAHAAYLTAKRQRHPGCTI